MVHFVLNAIKCVAAQRAVSLAIVFSTPAGEQCPERKSDSKRSLLVLI